MNAELVKKTALEVVTERYSFLLKDDFDIVAHQCTNHIAFGGRHDDIYGWVESHGAVVVATAFSPYGQSTNEFSNLKAACHFCIKWHFMFKH